MKSNKTKYKLTEKDIGHMFYQCGFVFGVQCLFLFVLYWTALPKFQYIRDTEINFVLFFSVFLMHCVCLPVANNGMRMMKYALLYPDEFTHPISAFMIGFYVFVTLIIAEVANIANAQSKKDVVGAVTGFIGYKAIIDIPSLYVNSFETLPVKSAVGKLTVKRSRTKTPDRPKIQADWMFNSLYVACNVFYKSVFFYFFPFGTMITPMLRSLQGNLNFDL
jgi:hypothetical protein